MVRGQNINMNTESGRSWSQPSWMTEWFKILVEEGTEDVVETVRELDSKVESEAMWQLLQYPKIS